MDLVDQINNGLDRHADLSDLHWIHLCNMEFTFNNLLMVPFCIILANWSPPYCLPLSPYFFPSSLIESDKIAWAWILKEMQVRITRSMT